MSERKPRSQHAQQAKGRELVITRIFDAPRELVWKAWTDAERVKRWWGPKGFTAPFSKIDLRVGGAFLHCMRSPEGKDYWSTGVYREIVPPERIVYADSFADEKGNVVPGSYYGLGSDFPLEMLVTLTFEEHEGKTKMTLRHAGLPAGDMRKQTGAGWNESFDKLAETLGGGNAPPTIIQPTIRIERTFRASPEHVWAQWTTKQGLEGWWGPEGFTSKVRHLDVRVRGTFEIEMTATGAVQVEAMESMGAPLTSVEQATYTTVVSPKHLTWISVFHFAPGVKPYDVIQTLELKAVRGGTRMILTSTPMHDPMWTGLAMQGWNESFDKLARVLVSRDAKLEVPRRSSRGDGVRPMSLAKKLNLKDGMTMRVLGKPATVDLGDVMTSTSPKVEGILVFVKSLADLDAKGGPVVEAARADRLAWIAYPKARQLGTDLNRDILWRHLLQEDIQGVRQIPLDDVWSAMRFRPRK